MSQNGTKIGFLAILLIGLGFVFYYQNHIIAEPVKLREKPKKDMNVKTEKATVGGGCFWCLEALFENVDGVYDAVSGYAGGEVDDPTYKQVCGGNTGHAEVVRIEFDPKKVSYEELLKLFWKAHDPTTLNRQGADVGTQYRSVIYYENEGQKKVAEASKKQAGQLFADPIVTEVGPLKKFYEAEEYHQDYFRNNPEQAYCTFVIRPKLKKFSEELKK